MKTNSTIPTEYAKWAFADVLRVYGHRPHECPAELRAWLDAAITMREIIDLKRSNDELERRLLARSN